MFIVVVLGYESSISSIIYEEVTHLSDEAYIDNIGNVIRLKRGMNPKVKIILFVYMDKAEFQEMKINNDESALKLEIQLITWLKLKTGDQKSKL